jgi:hypothetical protein
MANLHEQSQQAALAQHAQQHDQALMLAPDLLPDTKIWPPKRLEAWDRRRAAIHEAGHHVMACYRGMEEVDSWIERVGDPTLYEKSWVGRCRWHRPHPEAGQHDVMIAIAGLIAEALWRAGDDLEPMDIYDMLDDPYCMSESDWQGAGLNPDVGFTRKQQREIDEAFDLLRGPLWPELLRQARTLIIESRENAATSVMVAQLLSTGSAQG